MPVPLAKQVARRTAMDTAMNMADAISNSVGPSCSSADPNTVERTDANYFLSSIPMANFWCISPVPRELLALDDYRWDLLMQGIGPKNLVVHNCRNLSQRIPLEPDQREKNRQLRRLRNLQNLFIKSQSGKPELWIEAGEQVPARVNDGRSIDFFEEADADAGSSLHEVGEEEDERTNDDSQPGGERDRDGRSITKMMAMVEIEKDQRVVADLRALRCWLS